MVELKKDFLEKLDSCRDLYRHCLTPNGLHTNSGIEASFLQMQKALERFLEDMLLLILCGQQPNSGDRINPHFIVSDVEVARSIVYQNKQYIDWKKDEIAQRFSYFIKIPNRIEDAIKIILVDLGDVIKIRNFIAHSSKKAADGFYVLCQKKLGGSPNIKRASDFLILPDRDMPEDTYFERYVKIFEILVEKIIG